MSRRGKLTVVAAVNYRVESIFECTLSRTGFTLPHLIVEYSANIEDQIGLDALLDKLHTSALATGVFPLGGLRVRAHRTDHYRIADKAAENGFVHVTAMIGHGRPLDVQQRAGEQLFAALTEHLGFVVRDEPARDLAQHAGVPSGAEFQEEQPARVREEARRKRHEQRWRRSKATSRRPSNISRALRDGRRAAFHRRRADVRRCPATRSRRARRSTTRVLAQVAAGDAADVAAAATAAQRAFPAWRDLPGSERRDLLHDVADAIEARAEEIALLESLDTGQPIRFMSVAAKRGAENFRFFADKAPEADRGLSLPAREHVNYTLRQPLGPIAAITPWNTPFMLSTWKIAPALAAGCTVVHKPAEWSPITATLLAEIATAAGLPAGVLNTVHGLGETAGKAADASIRRSAPSRSSANRRRAARS